MVSEKKQYFLNLSVTSALLRSVKTLQTWAMCFVVEFEKLLCLVDTRGQIFTR